jgi:hypothetical protein
MTYTPPPQGFLASVAQSIKFNDYIITESGGNVAIQNNAGVTIAHVDAFGNIISDTGGVGLVEGNKSDANFPTFADGFTSSGLALLHITRLGSPVIHINNKTLQPQSSGLLSFGNPNPWNGGQFNGLISALGGIQRALLQSNSLAASYSTTSLSDISTGTGIQLSSIPTSNAHIIAVAYANNNTLGQLVRIKVYRSSIGIPAQGNPPSGTDIVVASATYTQEGAAGNNQPFTFNFVVSGITVGATLYFYITISVSGGTGTIVGGTAQTTIIGEPI